MQEQRAERDSLPARTFAPGPGLEKTTGDHGRTSSPGYRDSVGDTTTASPVAHGAQTLYLYRLH